MVGVATQHEEAIVAFFQCDLFLIDKNVAISFDLEKPAIAFVADETLVPASQLLTEGREDASPIAGILSPLFLIETDDVTAALDFDLFHLERSGIFGALALGGDFLPGSAALEHDFAASATRSRAKRKRVGYSRSSPPYPVTTANMPSGS